MRSNYKKLGKYIQQINNRNTDLNIDRLLGVSINKVLMPSIANTVGTNMKTYKIIKKNQFAYGPVTSRNGDKISIALLQEFDEAILSQAYTVFEVIDETELHPEYLMMWFRRPEFDRYARFKSHGSARETFDWDEMYEVELPIPSIEKQREIVKEYNTVVNRIKLNEKLNQKLEETAQALYKHWFVDFEFPNEEGKPYKSSGGAMVYNEELDKEIPEGWEVSILHNITENIFSGGTPNTSIEEYWGEELYWLSSGETRDSVIIDSERKITQEGVDNSSTKLARIGDSIMATAGQGKTRGQTSYCKIDSYINQSVICIRPVSEEYQSFIFFNLYSRYHELRNESDGQSIRGSLNKDNLSQLPILLPKNIELIKSYEKKGAVIIDRIYHNRCSSKKLSELHDLLLSKMTKVEQEKEVI